MSRIDAIILDWAGTTVDYGCFAPVNAFIAAFESFGIKVNIEETRAPMGLPKRKHIEKMLENMGRSYTQEDVGKIYASFEPALFEVLAKYADPLPGVIEAVAHIREMGVAIGSTTGYTRAMMNVVVPLAKEKGYAPDCIICPDNCNGIGRPYPYMLWRNLEKLGIASIHSVLKIGDTEADMQEGKNAGCLSAGVLKGSSMLALNGDEEIARQKYIEAGADYVIEDISALPALIKSLNQKEGV
ncbi:phosphonoacetaldehyde hydrolase [Fibrobacteria bacterium R8-3-H12]